MVVGGREGWMDGGRRAGRKERKKEAPLYCVPIPTELRGRCRRESYTGPGTRPTLLIALWPAGLPPLLHGTASTRAPTGAVCLLLVRVLLPRHPTLVERRRLPFTLKSMTACGYDLSLFPGASSGSRLIRKWPVCRSLVRGSSLGSESKWRRAMACRRL